MATSINVDSARVIAALTARSLKGKKQRTLEVGYAAPYATYVHENLAMAHPRGGQAKYLQEPARRYNGDIGKVVRRKLENKRSLDEALLAAGKFLLEKSIPLVPVDTGYLRDSSFNRLV